MDNGPRLLSRQEGLAASQVLAQMVAARLRMVTWVALLLVVPLLEALLWVALPVLVLGALCLAGSALSRWCCVR